jgi:hypothetical protein
VKQGHGSLFEGVLGARIHTFQSVWCGVVFVLPWREQVNFQRDDDDVRFVLDQHAELEFYSASSLQQTAGRHVARVGCKDSHFSECVVWGCFCAPPFSTKN